MTSLNLLLNYQKGKILHSLFPEEIPCFLKFLYLCGQKISSEPSIVKVILLSFPDSELNKWKEIANEVNNSIDNNHKRLITNAHLFGYEIFDYFRGSYTIHCLRSYTMFKKTNDKFKAMVDILFT